MWHGGPVISLELNWGGICHWMVSDKLCWLSWVISLPSRGGYDVEWCNRGPWGHGIVHAFHRHRAQVTSHGGAIDQE